MKSTESQLEQSVISLLEKEGIPHTFMSNFVKVLKRD